MAQRVIAGAKVYVDVLDVSAEVSTFQLTSTSTLVENTSIEDSAITRLQGIPNHNYSYEMFWDETPDETLFTNLGSTGNQITVCPETGSEGERSIVFDGLDTAYTPGGQIGEMFAGNISGEVDGEIRQSYISYNQTTSIITDGTGIQLGALADSTESIKCYFHIYAYSGFDHVQIILKSDDNAGFTSATTQVFSGNLTSAQTGVLTIDGPITDDYWRVNIGLLGVGSVSVLASIVKVT